MLIFLKSYLQNVDNFKKAILLSVFFHFLIVFIFVIKTMLFSKPLIDLSQAISVNIGDFTPPDNSDKLPEKIQPNESASEEVAVNEKPQKPTAVKQHEKLPKKIEKAKSDDFDVKLVKSKNKQKAALDKLKKLSALDKIKQDLNKEVTDAALAKNKRLKIRSAKPYVLSAGTTLTGLDKIDATNYLLLIDSNIKQAWSLPQWLLNKKLKAKVLVKFNTQGQIISTKLIEASGNSTYDNYCLQAVNQAAPFPKVPEKFSEKFSVDGLVIGFPE